VVTDGDGQKVTLGWNIAGGDAVGFTLSGPGTHGGSFGGSVRFADVTGLAAGMHRWTLVADFGGGVTDSRESNVVTVSPVPSIPTPTNLVWTVVASGGTFPSITSVDIRATWFSSIPFPTSNVSIKVYDTTIGGSILLDTEVNVQIQGTSYSAVIDVDVITYDSQGELVRSAIIEFCVSIQVGDRVSEQLCETRTVYDTPGG